MNTKWKDPKGNKLNKQRKKGKSGSVAEQLHEWTNQMKFKLTGNDFLQALRPGPKLSCLFLRGGLALQLTEDTIRCHGTGGVPDSLCIPLSCPTEKAYASPSPKVPETPKEVSWIASQTHTGALALRAQPKPSSSPPPEAFMHWLLLGSSCGFVLPLIHL